MIKILLVAFLAVKFENVYAVCKKSVTTASGTTAPKTICSGALIFEDNFDTFDLTKWHHEQTLGGGGNNEFEWYTANKKNSYAENGILHIKPTLVADERGENFLYSGTIDLKNKCTDEDKNSCRRTGTPDHILNPIKSARIRTSNSFSFKYGRLEIRAKTPTGDWLWPALWLLPSNYVYGGGIESGEIDLLETRGNKRLLVGDGFNLGVTQMGSTLHWGPNSDNNQFPKTSYEQTLAKGYNKRFHKYQLEWTRNYIKFSVDDKEIGKVVPPGGGFWELGDLQQTGLNNPWQGASKMAPFDEEFHLIINLAIGGNFFPDDADNKSGKKPWSNSDPENAMTAFWEGISQWKPTWNLNTDDSHFQIDYVKIWAL